MLIAIVSKTKKLSEKGLAIYGELVADQVFQRKKDQIILNDGTKIIAIVVPMIYGMHIDKAILYCPPDDFMCFMRAVRSLLRNLSVPKKERMVVLLEEPEIKLMPWETTK